MATWPAAIEPKTKTASEAPGVRSGPPVSMKKPLRPPTGYAAVTTPVVVTLRPAYGEVSVSVPWISAIDTVTAGAATTMVNEAEALTPPASVAVTVTVAVPASAGVPVSTPAADSVRPAGRPVAVQVYGVAPPVATRVSGAIAVPAVAFWLPGLVTATAVPPPSDAAFCGVG